MLRSARNVLIYILSQLDCKCINVKVEQMHSLSEQERVGGGCIIV